MQNPSHQVAGDFAFDNFEIKSRLAVIRQAGIVHYALCIVHYALMDDLGGADCAVAQACHLDEDAGGVGSHLAAL